MQTADLRDYLAAERTFLAWIRTGLALMGFGFVVARFGLFLQQLQLVQHQPAAGRYGISLWLGTALIAVGVIVNLSSAWHDARLMRPLESGHRNSRWGNSGNQNCFSYPFPAVTTDVARYFATAGSNWPTSVTFLRSSASITAARSSAYPSMSFPVDG
jgi:uncharacterized membrane protein YidH (DUF202 family)